MSENRRNGKTMNRKHGVRIRNGRGKRHAAEIGSKEVEDFMMKFLRNFSFTHPIVLKGVERRLESKHNNISFADFIFLLTTGIAFASFTAFKAVLKYVGFWIVIGLITMCAWNTMNFFIDWASIIKG